jgi:two-component system sensor histidine kinase YesM
LETGFGIGNVNQRTKLYYGKQYGLSVKSEYNTGTCVTLVIPAKKEDVIDGDRSRLIEKQEMIQ